ncbi:MAG: 50S ribosomal protein L9 [Candidatus Nomurabacteria bacterium]|nr:50S ribosomal protein L9 [Candidatus Nomurabacteria bacterium]
MKVILLKKIKNIGQPGDVKNVADGYACNHLIPNKLAVPADDAHIKQINDAKNKQSEQSEQKKQKISDTLNKINNKKIVIENQSNGSGALYAQIGVGDVTSEIKKQLGVVIDASWVQLKKPIKEKGKHTVVITSNKQSAEIVVVV